MVSYRIEYDGAVGKYEVRKIKTGKFPLLYTATMIIGLAFLCLIRPQAREVVRSVLIPGSDAVTTAAFQTMTNDLRSGAGLYDAFFDFCHMVLHGA